MINKKKCIAMLLAGGAGARLGVLTKMRAKPAVSYGGKYKLIDFTLSNCAYSGIDTIGVLTQYQPLELNSYIGTGASWDLDSNAGGVYILPPYQNAEHGKWYSGTADAIFQNSYFIDKFDPEYLLVLSGDHIYKMDYHEMLQYHIQHNADATIAVIRVPLSQASRFGIMNTDETDRVVEFEEKPRKAKSDLASMGVYIFSWKKIREYLIRDSSDPDSSNDFGKNIIPRLIDAGETVFAYRFDGYWKDVGTIESLWEANMELLQEYPPLDLYDPTWKILSRNPMQPPHYAGTGAVIKRSLVSEGCEIFGTVENSVLFSGVKIGKGAVIRDSIIMQNSVVRSGCAITRAIVDEEALIEENCEIGGSDKITVIGYGAVIGKDATVEEGRQVNPQTVYSVRAESKEVG
jgi:glucose-1-phosphate adenylyltransferase